MCTGGSPCWSFQPFHLQLISATTGGHPVASGLLLLRLAASRRTVAAAASTQFAGLGLSYCAALVGSRFFLRRKLFKAVSAASVSAAFFLLPWPRPSSSPP